jgi:3D (Asp-Asp-Asp) domain-containing protein
MRKWIIPYVLLAFLVVLFFVSQSKSYEVIPETEATAEVITVVEEKIILGRVENMTVTCYTLVEFASNGVTASGKEVSEGMVASNKLPFGTKLEIEGFKDKIFVVEDRFMKGWKHADLDIYWGDGLEAYKDCKKWGKNQLQVLILQEGTVFAS